MPTFSATPAGWSCRRYDTTGTLNLSLDSLGQTTAPTSSAGANYAAPGLIRLNNVAASDTNIGYNAWFAPVSIAGPNGTQSTANYDEYARPMNSTSVYGAVGNYVYNYGPAVTPPAGAPPLTAGPPYTQTAVTNGRWTRTTLDGLGRTIKAETGAGGAVNSTVDTEYDSCVFAVGEIEAGVAAACAGRGGVLDHLHIRWNGRTVSVTAADGASTTS